VVNAGATWQQKSSGEDSHLILKPGHGGQAVARERGITPAQAFGIIADRIERRMETLRRVSDSGFAGTICELDILLGQVRKAQQYFISQHARPQPEFGPRK